MRIPSCRPPATSARIRRALLTGIIAIGLGTSGLANASDPANQRTGLPIGEITAIQGNATILPAGAHRTRPASVGTVVYARDVLQTETNARMRIRFKDESLLTLGASASFRVNRFDYSKERGTVTALLTVAKGFFRSITGKLKLRRNTVVRTSTATLGIRGTDFMGEATSELTQVFVSEGAVAVTGLDPHSTNEVTLEPGEGTAVRAGEGPRAKRRWPQSKVERFESLTSL